jgi:ABC-2 type transport system ATP-binding protein
MWRGGDREDASVTSIVLRATDLTKRYGDIVAVDGLSLDVRRGEILGFLGPNGAGKTTTLRMLCGLLSPDSGRVELDGRPVSAGSARASRTIGVSPQAVSIWDMLTCREQLAFMGRIYDLPRREASAGADRLLAAFGLLDKADRLGRTLSGGMQRRLSIALALVHEPEVLFLDEPQAGLDPQSRVLVRDYIRALAGRTTVIVTTHDMEEAEKLSDRVCIIDRGCILVVDTVEGVKDAVAGLGESGGVRPATLEDVFIRLTGRGLRE